MVADLRLPCRLAFHKESFDMTIKVLLAEDDEVFRIGLKTALGNAADIDLIAVCEDGQAAVDFVNLSQPDVVLMD
ncbi:MAG: hypothetical protein P0107_09055, partial [Nitrosomonas sp.]|nr:hypothetical protein [Nitrosomonas sp.]